MFKRLFQIRCLNYHRKLSKDCEKFLVINRNFITSKCLCGDYVDSSQPKTENKLNDEQEKRLLKKRKKEEKRKERIESQKLKAEAKKSEEECLYTVPTEPGEKKDTSVSLPKAYKPKYTEAAWYAWWEKQGFFNPDFKKGIWSRGDRFVICLPPPNVTGNLHLGHALGNSIEDAILRWHRMSGRQVLWVPGCDHAGIATQVVVEKKLWREQGLTRHDVGREEFVKQVWKWKEEKGVTIYDQMRRLGSSLDWTRDVFTLDPILSRAVTEAFIRLHDEGLIYRCKRMVNWSSALNSAISDIEVDNKIVTGRTLLQVPGYEKKVPFGELTYFAYPVENSDEELVVATTRPETMLGDTGVAVHPEDSRYLHLHGRAVIHPFSGRSIPVLTDTFVEMDYGTGAVKLTPGHDQTDWEVGQKHNLDLLEILDDKGDLVNVPESFQGMKRFDARVEVIRALKDKGLYRGRKDNPMSIPICSRSSDVIEKRLKDQWYVRCEKMAQKAMQVVKSGELQLIPSQYEKQWFDWLEKTQDWCISRQLWWGHRIPAYQVTSKQTSQQQGAETWVCAHSHTEAVDKAGQQLGVSPSDIEVTQDEDVLDTWFSSALFPFSVFGWPEQTSDLAQFYPIDLLETASDIMFFWVARMVMLGQKLTGHLPFKQVLFHSILRDAHGRKMSKSLGNVIDPMDVIEGVSLQELQSKLRSGNLSQSEIKKAQQGQERDFPLGIPQCGADPLRFTLCSYNYKAHFLNIDVEHVRYHRNFCNKIWQAFKYTTSHLGEDFAPMSLRNLQLCDLTCSTDKWILSRLSHLVECCDKNFTSYDLNIAAQGLLTFWWHEFCDIYLEYSKKALQSSASAPLTSQILYNCVETGLRLMAPFMPYITEELFQRLPRRPESHAESVCIDDYPKPSDYPWQNSEIETEMEKIQTLMSSVLNMRKSFRLTKARPQVFIRSDNPHTRTAVESHQLVFKTLTKSDHVTLLRSSDFDPEWCCSSDQEDGDKVFLLLKGHIDVTTERTHQEKEMEKLQSQLDKLLDNPAHEKHLQLIQEEKIRSIKSELEKISKIKESLQQWDR